MSAKTYLSLDVMTAARQRVRRILQAFPRFYVSVSGGKDSSALVQLVIEEARAMNRLPVPILIVDLEAQYQHTVAFLERLCARTDEVMPYWICLPIHLRNAVSQIKPHWLCWDESARALWVRDYPNHSSVIHDSLFLPFFRPGMEFEEFTPAFGDWFADGQPTACFVGIRADESINRFRTIKRQDKRLWDNEPWTTWISNTVCNVYPIYDWRTEDVWIAHGRQGWDYNRIYDLMHLAGLSIHQMRLCQPYGDDQRKGLWLFKILEPETWAKVVNRVQGANFGNRYVELTGNVFGNIRISLPEGHTWKSYSKLLLTTMPEPTALHYRRKIWTFLRWWRKHRKEFGITRIPDFTDPRIESKRALPSWRRIAKTLLKNDYWCKTLSFSQTKREMERQLAVVTKYLSEL